MRSSFSGDVVTIALIAGLGSWGCANVREAGGGRAATGGAKGDVNRPAGPDAGTDVAVITLDARSAEGCGLTRFMVERTPTSVLLLLDRSGSMKEKPSGATGTATKWDLVVPALEGVITGTTPAIAWAYKSFPEGSGKECADNGVTSVIDVPLGNAGGRALTDAIDLTLPEGSGTPTARAVSVASDYLKGVQDGSRRYILLATDGEPSCPDSGAADLAVEAVTSAAAAGIKTFVVGIATTKASASATLNRLAVAGGLPAANAASATQYYLASTSSDLLEALGKITGQVATCEFSFASAPLVPDNIAVDVAGVRLPRNDADGWSYVDDTHRAIRINGPSCSSILRGASGSQSVQVAFGCPDQVIP